MIGLKVAVDRNEDGSWPELRQTLLIAFDQSATISLSVGSMPTMRCMVMSWQHVRGEPEHAVFMLVAEAPKKQTILNAFNQPITVDEDTPVDRKDWIP